MTGIVASLGPAIWSREQLRACFEAGVSAIRCAGAKFEPDRLEPIVDDIRAAASETGRHVDLLLDLPGTKPRLANPEPFRLGGLSKVRLSYRPVPTSQEGANAQIGLDARELAPLIEIGDVMVLGDGENALHVVSVAADHCDTVPLTAGLVGRRTGVTIAGKQLRHESLAEGDLSVLKSMAHLPFNGVIVSFVEAPETIESARSVVADAYFGPNAPRIMAKIETPQGVRNASSIAAAADAVLVGRGDLLISAPLAEFHHLTMTCIDVVRRTGTPVTVGTQLLPSLAESWLPNRSELAYVSLLLEQGVDGLMLASETTRGTQATRTVELLASLVRHQGGTVGDSIFKYG